MLCHSSVFHTIILHLVWNFQGKTFIFCCMFHFFYLSFQVENFSPLLDLKVLNFLSSDPIIYLDGPIFSTLLIALLLSSPLLAEARYWHRCQLWMPILKFPAQNLFSFHKITFHLKSYLFFKVHLQSLKWEWNICFFHEKNFNWHSSSFEKFQSMNSCKGLTSFGDLKKNSNSGKFLQNVKSHGTVKIKRLDYHLMNSQAAIPETSSG